MSKPRHQRIIEAQERVERAACRLIESGENLSPHDPSAHTRSCRRQDLLQSARRYGRAIQNLSRISR